MKDEDLIRMSRQIADFFAPYSEAEAIEGVQTHLRDFWEPRMRMQLAEIYAQSPEKLHPVVRAAAAKL